MSPALYRSMPLRRIALAALRTFSPGDITIKHHWWPEAKVRLDCYRHKGYWFHGRNRERAFMERIAELVGEGDVAIDIGGHIGYLALHLRGLVGPEGRVIVFEPGANNLPYIQANCAAYPNIEIVTAACSEDDGEAEFWVEDLTGQNNSLLNNYKTFDDNKRRAFSGATTQAVKVKTLRLDGFLKERGLKPDFIKIDVEGAELQVLRGAEACLRAHKPKLMVEVTENKAEVETLLRGLGYAIHREGDKPEWVCLPG
jgi:FkbM family methyltransferase